MKKSTIVKLHLFFWGKLDLATVLCNCLTMCIITIRLFRNKFLEKHY